MHWIKLVFHPALALCFLHTAAFADSTTTAGGGQFELPECRKVLREQPEGAAAYCDQLLPPHSSKLTRDEATRLRIDLASNAIILGKFPDAEQYLGQALLNNEKLLENNFYRFNWLRIKAMAYSQQGKYSAAVPYQREALQVAQALGNNRSIATSYNDLGASAMEIGDYNEALENFKLALTHLENTENHYSIALTLANIAAVYRGMEDLTASVEYLRRSLAAQSKHLAEEPEDFYARRALAQVREDLGISLTQLGSLDEARNELALALETYAAADLKLDQIRVLAANADIELAAGNPHAALTMLNRGLGLEPQTAPAKSLPLRQGMVAAFLATGQYMSARESAMEGLILAQENVRLPEELFFLENLSTIHRALGELPEAMEYLQAYVDRYKSILKTRYDIEVAELGSSIESKAQAREIANLEATTIDLQQSLRAQRWLLIACALLALSLFMMLILLRRQRLAREDWLRREISLHRQGYDDSVEDAGLPTDDGTIDAAPGEVIDEDPDFSAALVTLMRSCIDVWEQATGESRIELAEKSGIWQVTVDDGRLRTRTMDRYADIKKLPKVPRWKQVARTCRYILIECELSDDQRRRLNDELERVFAIHRQEQSTS